jgi:hypothetical protein
MGRQDLISGEPNRGEAGLYMERWYVLPMGSPTAMVAEVAEATIKPNRLGDPEAGRAQRVADPRVRQ